jgi:hypothetical protein
MNDPAFKAEMEKMMDMPEYKDAFEKAQDELADLQSDPAKLAGMQQQARRMMNQ